MTSAIAESLDTDSLDLETLLELSRRSDDVGVLSLYVDARPEALRTASIDIKNRITRAACRRWVTLPIRQRRVHCLDGL
jgi:hypothetical protein